MTFHISRLFTENTFSSNLCAPQQISLRSFFGQKCVICSYLSQSLRGRKADVTESNNSCFGHLWLLWNTWPSSRKTGRKYSQKRSEVEWVGSCHTGNDDWNIPADTGKGDSLLQCRTRTYLPYTDERGMAAMTTRGTNFSGYHGPRKYQGANDNTWSGWHSDPPW